MIKILKSIVIFLLTVSLVSCTNGTDEHTSSYDDSNFDSKLDTTNIIFMNKHDIDNSFHLSDKISTQNISLISVFNANSENKIRTTSGKKFDNISFISNENYINFRHYTNFLDFQDYLISKGDSITVEYANGKLTVHVPNRNILKYDLSFEEFVRNRLVTDKYSPLAEYLGAEHLYAKKYFSDKDAIKKGKTLTLTEVTIRNDEGRNEIKREYGEGAKLYLEGENMLLDSIKKMDQISIPVFAFYKEKIKYLKLLIDLETDRIDSIRVKAVLDTHKKNNYGYPELYYLQFLKAVEKKYFADNFKYSIYDGTISKDYREIYLRINNSHFLPEKDKNYLLAWELNKINSLFSHEDFISFYEKFENSVKDTALIRSVRKEYALEFDSSRNEISSVVLQNISGDKLTLEKLKEKHKGKIIYVDYWASWCGPCREAMPTSTKLRTALKSKDVVFIYLSIDKSRTAWQKASTKEKLSDYTENYLIINHETSNFLKSNKLTSIPRYMIFDKTGRLTHANAPRVESIEIGSLLINLAAKP